MSRTRNVAVVGATGAVGRETLRVLEQRGFPIGELRLFASARSAGRAVPFAGGQVPVRELACVVREFEGIDLALVSAGGAISKRVCPVIAAAGAVAIDKSSAFRMEPDVPLVVPEVNPEAVRNRPRGIIANPNCATIQIVVAIAPLHRAARIRRMVVSTYQSASGAGEAGRAELEADSRAFLDGRPPVREKFARPLGFNCVPLIDKMLESGRTFEEQKTVDETRKILGDDSIRIAPMTVRVPVMVGHAAALFLEFERPMDPDKAWAILCQAPGVVVVDEPSVGKVPTPRDSAGTDAVAVGRIHRDPTVEHGLVMWVAADNLRKGAATNGVQIAELVAREE
ncbi:MAG: aspartate-semialdehyde dehydrogenase [Deltaproteobacteria bacterium]|nr:aspartate-semialdehyde dehydrogenase [Deltaproteobacteria bacterium]